MSEFWGRKEVADYLEVKTDSINGYALPVPDVRIGNHRGWFPETIKKWAKKRPGHGNWDRAAGKNRPYMPTDEDDPADGQ